MGTKGLVWSSAAMGVLLNEGIGDTIRVSLTPRPNGDRREEVYAACELLQSLGLRSFSPSVTACPGCGRTTSSTFQELAERIQDYIREMMPTWKTTHEGVETMTLAVMGCVVNGPGESKAASIGISLPGHRRGAELPGLHRRSSRQDPARHLRRARGGISASGRRLRRDDVREESVGRHAGRSLRGAAPRRPSPRVGLLRIPPAPARGDARDPRLARQRRRPPDRRRQVAVLSGAGGRGRGAGPRRLAAHLADEGSGRRPARRRRRGVVPEQHAAAARARRGDRERARRTLPAAVRVARAARRRRRPVAVAPAASRPT